MDTTTNWKPFVKTSALALPLGALGALTGYSFGHSAANAVSRRVGKQLRETEGQVDAKEAAKKLKPLLPDTHFLTTSDFVKAKDKAKDPYHKAVLENLISTLSTGNAFAIHPFMLSPGAGDRLPEIIANKKVVATCDKVHPDVIAHEAGHILDYDEAVKSDKFRQFWVKNMRWRVTAEKEAWNKAPDHGKPFTLKDPALATYRARAYYPLAGAAVGGTTGGLAGAALESGASSGSKTASEYQTPFLRRILDKQV